MWSSEGNLVDYGFIPATLGIQEPWGCRTWERAVSIPRLWGYRQGGFGKSIWTRAETWDSLGCFLVWCGGWGWCLPGRNVAAFGFICLSPVSTESFKMSWWEEVSKVLGDSKAVTALMLSVHGGKRGRTDRRTQQTNSSKRSWEPQSWMPRSQTLESQRSKSLQLKSQIS